MHPGDLIADRFLLEKLAGSGGMGEVYKALDQQTGQPVAVKLLSGKRGDDAVRFVREAHLLANLHHPHIVRHVAHGTLPSGEPYLAMQWLDGEDLSARLVRGSLSPAESVQLAGRIAEALGVAHARGVVHRDLKPSNVFLVGGQLRDAILLDFGIAHLNAATRMTRTGMLMGTPGYMAPEQARGSERIDARADVFSLGCVLFECLTGEPAFRGAHLVAVLAKVLFDEPPSVREKLPALPDALDALVGRMLAKNPENRLREGGAVAEALRAIGELPELSMPPPPGVAQWREALTGSEQRAVAVILVGAPERRAPEGVGTGTEMNEDDSLAREAARFGGHLERLANGSAAVVLAGMTLATDLAAQAARCALSLHACASGRSVALAMGRGDLTGRLPMGHAIDRAASLFTGKAPERLEPLSAPVVLDGVAARLLDARFDVREADAGFVLHRERSLGEGTRTLLGKATPCVGRERDLRMLEELFSECVEESVAQAVLVTAPPGAGKSRLGQEFLRQLKDRGEPAAIWIGRGDSLRAGAAFTLLGQVLRGACSIREGEPLEMHREKLVTRVAERVADPERRRVAEFLGEIIGTPFPDENSLPLRTARTDAQLMNDQMRAAFFDFLAAECDANPVLIVLEDLHWGDRPTVQFLDRALRDLRHKALFVLAMARPEVHDLFPKLWADKNVQEVRLHKLSSRAIERLSRHVLGERVDRATIERLVELSEGNAFYLEELIRATAEGKGADLPQTVVAMVQSRLGALDEPARRLLRAASVFGEAFWAGAVASLLGSVDNTAGVLARVGELVERELVVKRSESRFSGRDEYAFRHALLREGAYAMLTEGDRALGHKLAGEWLERHGEQEAVVLAEHFEKGGDGARAGPYYLLATEQASTGGDATAALACARRGLACRMPDELRIPMLGAICEAHFWQRETVNTALPYAEELAQVAPSGSGPWVRGMLIKLYCALQSGRFADFLGTLGVIRAIEPSVENAAPLVLALGMGTYCLDLFGKIHEGNALRDRITAIGSAVGDRAPIPLAVSIGTAGMRDAYAKEDPWDALTRSDAALAIYKAIDHRRYIEVAWVYKGMNQWFLGASTDAERTLLEVTLPGETANTKPFMLAWLLADRDAFNEAQPWATLLAESGQTRRRPLDEGRGRWVLAEVLRRMGELDAANTEIQAALALLPMVCPLEHPGALATLAALRLAQNRPVEALAAAEEGMTKYDSMGACGVFRGAFLRLTHAECLEATGNHDAARAAIAKARDRLFTIADKPSSKMSPKTERPSSLPGGGSEKAPEPAARSTDATRLATRGKVV